MNFPDCKAIQTKVVQIAFTMRDICAFIILAQQEAENQHGCTNMQKKKKINMNKTQMI